MYLNMILKINVHKNFFLLMYFQVLDKLTK